MNPRPDRSLGRLWIAAVIAAVLLGSLSFLAYQSYAVDHSSSNTSNSAVSGSQASSTTTATSSGGHESTSVSTASEDTTFVTFLPCNCTVDVSEGWPAFGSLSALVSASYTVIVATVTSETTAGVNDSVLWGYNVGLLPVTDYNITVSQVVYDRVDYGLKPGYWLFVDQVGGTFGHTTMNVTGYPTLAVGQSYVFFLTGPTPIEGAYNENLTTVGAAQGLFYVQGGDVYSLDNMYPQADAWLPVKVSGVPLAQFIQAVQSAATSTTTASTTSTVSSSSALQG